MLTPRTTPGANVIQTEQGWLLQIPNGPAGTYRLAQLDNYRSRFPLSTPATLSLRCRVSARLLAGTWGFGFWNDPFTISLGLQGTSRRLPVLPNAGWFFHASAQNYLSLRPPVDSTGGAQGSLPAQGFLAQSFSSPKIPSLLLALGLLALPLMLSKPSAKWIRAIAGKIIGEDAKRLEVDATQWHDYKLRWDLNQVAFNLDGESVFETETSPKGPLGLVIWIDNQYAAFTPDGKISAGTEENPVPAWMEIADLELS